jgi:hypothetical protein
MSKNPTAVGSGSAIATRPHVPAVNLMPPYVAQRRAGRALQIRVLVVLAVVVVALVGGYVGVSIWKGAAEERLAAAKVESTRLEKERKQYAEVISVMEQLEATNNALLVAVTYEMRWPELIAGVFNNMPTGSTVESINLQGMSATQAIGAPESPLAPPRIGAVNVVINVPSLKEVGDWVDGFNLIAGLEDGGWSAVSRQSVASVFQANCSAQINLAGLVGSVYLPQDFQDWLANAHQGNTQPPAEEG